MSQWGDRLRIHAEARPGTVTCLPDLFLDHLVPLEEGQDPLAAMADVAERGGGNLATGPQRLEVGGNAANLAHALARLGVRARLVAPTDDLGAHLARRDLAPDGVDLAGVRPTGPAAHTVALELDPTGGEGANVMLSDPGPLDGFHPDDLADADVAGVREADAVAVVNWAKTQPHGTALLEAVAGAAGEAGTTVYVDTSDPTTRPPEDREAFLASEAVTEAVDVWGLNDHEARTWARAVGADPGTPQEAGDALADLAEARIDVHWEAAAWTRRDGPPLEVEGFDVPVRQRTGAGDAWNAGNVLADLLDLPSRERLQVAHGTAALLVREGEPPTRGTLAEFLEERTG